MPARPPLAEAPLSTLVSPRSEHPPTDAGREVVAATPNGVTPNVDMMSLRPEMAGGINGALKLEAIIRSRCTASRLSRDTPVSTTREFKGARDRRGEDRETATSSPQARCFT